MFHNLHVLGMTDDLWDRVCEIGSEIESSTLKYNFWNGGRY